MEHSVSVLSGGKQLSVTLVHPAKAVGRNEMPFGRDTRVVSSNTALDGRPSPPCEGEIRGSESPVCSDAIYHQITLPLVYICFCREPV